VGPSFPKTVKTGNSLAPPPPALRKKPRTFGFSTLVLIAPTAVPSGRPKAIRDTGTLINRTQKKKLTKRLRRRAASSCKVQRAEFPAQIRHQRYYESRKKGNHAMRCLKKEGNSGSSQGQGRVVYKIPVGPGDRPKLLGRLEKKACWFVLARELAGRFGASESERCPRVMEAVKRPLRHQPIKGGNPGLRGFVI